MKKITYKCEVLNEKIISVLKAVSTYFVIKQIWIENEYGGEFSVYVYPNKSGDHISVHEGPRKENIWRDCLGEGYEVRVFGPRLDPDPDARADDFHCGEAAEIAKMLNRAGIPARTDIPDEEVEVVKGLEKDGEGRKYTLYELLGWNKKVDPRLEKKAVAFLKKHFALEDNPVLEEQEYAIRVFPTHFMKGKKLSRVLRTLESLMKALSPWNYDFDSQPLCGYKWGDITAWLQSAWYHANAMRRFGRGVVRTGFRF